MLLNFEYDRTAVHLAFIIAWSCNRCCAPMSLMCYRFFYVHVCMSWIYYLALRCRCFFSHRRIGFGDSSWVLLSHQSSRRLWPSQSFSTVSPLPWLTPRRSIKIGTTYWFATRVYDDMLWHAMTCFDMLWFLFSWKLRLLVTCFVVQASSLSFLYSPQTYWLALMQTNALHAVHP